MHSGSHYQECQKSIVACWPCRPAHLQKRRLDPNGCRESNYHAFPVVYVPVMPSPAECVTFSNARRTGKAKRPDRRVENLVTRRARGAGSLARIFLAERRIVLATDNIGCQKLHFHVLAEKHRFTGQVSGVQTVASQLCGMPLFGGRGLINSRTCRMLRPPRFRLRAQDTPS